MRSTIKIWRGESELGKLTKYWSANAFFPCRGQRAAKSSRFQKTAVVEWKVIEEKKVQPDTCLTVESFADRKLILKIASDEYLGPSDKNAVDQGPI